MNNKTINKIKTLIVLNVLHICKNKINENQKYCKIDFKNAIVRMKESKETKNNYIIIIEFPYYIKEEEPSVNLENLQYSFGTMEFLLMIKEVNSSLISQLEKNLNLEISNLIIRFYSLDEIKTRQEISKSIREMVDGKICKSIWNNSEI